MSVSEDRQQLQTAISFQQAGRLDRAADLYRQIINRNPKNFHALHYLGLIEATRGNHQQAKTLMERSLAIEPPNIQFAENYATILFQTGDYKSALEISERGLRLDHANAPLLYISAISLYRLKQLQESMAQFDKLLLLAPNHIAAINERGSVLAELKEYDAALASFDKALALQPQYAEAYLNKGNALAELKRYDDAAAAYDKALALTPDLADAWLGRGIVFMAAWKPELAVHAFSRALELKETPLGKALFASSVKFTQFAADSGDRFRNLVLRAVSEGWVRPRELANVCISLIKLNGVVNDCIARANSAWPARLPAAELLDSRGMAALSHDELLHCLLECDPVTDIGLERLLVNVRHVMLTSAADDARDERLLGFYSAVARQCFVNGYVFSVTEAEGEAAHRLRAALEEALAAGAPCPVLWLVVVGAYFSLQTLSKPELLLDRTWPKSVEALLVQQVKEPAQERQLAATVPRLTSVDGEVSRAVRQQYEESPYPLWIKAGPPAMPAILNDRGSEPVLDVLVAGCGTGLFTIEFARHAPKARLLAIDLSVASLSYAKRMSQSFDIGNIEFAQADIMKLASIRREFDFIDASGVLHHLADPWAGWRILLSPLRPGGVMQVGLYSELARQNVVAARALIAERGFRPVPEDIRRVREILAAAEDGSPLKSLTQLNDYFAMSECRDLLFHPQEHRVVLPQIKSFLAANGLQFAGFNLSPSARHRFATRFPEPEALTDLDLWHSFETEAPGTFVAMYQFWVRKPDA